VSARQKYLNPACTLYSFFCYNSLIDKKTIDEVVKNFILKGGKINSYYMVNTNRKPVLVFYKRWYRGRNIREAITRALAG